MLNSASNCFEKVKRWFGRVKWQCMEADNTGDKKVCTKKLLSRALKNHHEASSKICCSWFTSGFKWIFVCYSKQISGCKHLFQLYLQHQLKDVTSKYNCSFVTALKNSLNECMTVYKIQWYSLHCSDFRSMVQVIVV